MRTLLLPRHALPLAAALLLAGPAWGQAAPPAPPEAPWADPAAPTDVPTLDRWVRAAAADLAAAAPGADPEDAPAPPDIGGGGVWRFAGFGVGVIVIADGAADRMRVMSPVITAGGGHVAPDAAAMRRVLEANFGSALDARYVLREGRLWTASLHPLSTLDEAGLRSRLLQVINLNRTYGDTYSSSGLRFGGAEEPGGDAGDGELI